MESPSWRAMPVRSGLQRSDGGEGSANACPDTCRRCVIAVPWHIWLAWQYVISVLCLFAAHAAFPASLGERNKSFGGVDELNEVVSVLLPVTLLLTRVSLNHPIVLMLLLHAGAVALAGVGVAVSAHVAGGFYPVACVFTSLAFATTSVAVLACIQQACSYATSTSPNTNRGSHFGCVSCWAYQLMSVLAGIATVGVFSWLGLLRSNLPEVFLVSCLSGVCVFFFAYRASTCRPVPYATRSADSDSPHTPPLYGVAIVGLVLLDTTLVLYLEFLCRIFVAATQCRKTSRVNYWPRMHRHVNRRPQGRLGYDHNDNDIFEPPDELSLASPHGSELGSVDATGTAVKEDINNNNESVAVDVQMELLIAPERQLKHRQQMSRLIKVCLGYTCACITHCMHYLLLRTKHVFVLTHAQSFPFFNLKRAARSLNFAVIGYIR